MTDAESTPKKLPEVTWRGRTMRLKIPNAAQLMTWSRMATEFGRIGQTPDNEEIDKKQYQKALQRLGSIVFGVFEDEDDKDWLEDEILEGRVDDQGLLDLFTSLGDQIQNFQEDDDSGNATAPAKKKTARRVRG
jgi:hypothetical protein